MRQKKKKPFKFRQEATKHYEDARKPQVKRRFDPECTDRCHKCGDFLHREGFRCPAAKHHCKICKKIGHFSSLCYKKIEKNDYYQRSLQSSSPKAHQFKVWSVQTQSLYDQSDDYSSEDSFCLQLKMQPHCDETETKFIAPHHLVTNHEVKLKPHKKRITFLRTRIDTCTNVNLMVISVYHLLYKDSDCVKIASSSKSGILTYTNEKIPVLGSCVLFVVHPDTRCLKEVTFQVVNHEGSVLVSCTKSIELGLVQPHSALNANIPDCERLIYSNADHPGKYKSKKIQPVSKLSDDVYAREVQATAVPSMPTTEVTQWQNKEVQAENKLQQCPAKVYTVLEERKYQKVKSAHMQPQKPKSCEMQLEKSESSASKGTERIKASNKGKKPNQATQRSVCQDKNS